MPYILKSRYLLEILLSKRKGVIQTLISTSYSLKEYKFKWKVAMLIEQ